MSLDYNLPAVLPVFVATALLVFVLTRVWRDRSERMAPWLICTIVLLLGWAVGLVFELTNRALPTKLFWANLEFVAIMPLPLVWLLTLRRIVDARAPRLWWQVGGWLVTALLVASVFVNPDHLFRGYPSIAVVDGERALNYDYRVLFFLGFVPWAAVLLAFGSGLLIRGMSQTPHLFRRRNQILLTASLLPMAGLAIYLSNTLPWRCFDPTFICVSGAVLLCGYAVLRYRVLDVAPLARGALIDHLAGGVVVLDACERVIDFNAAAQAAFPGLGGTSIGRRIEEVLPGQRTLSEAVRRAGAPTPAASNAVGQRCEVAASADAEPGGRPLADEPGDEGEAYDDATVVIEVGEGDAITHAGQRHYAVSITPMRDRGGACVGSVAIFHDVTRRVVLYRQVREMAVTDELTGLCTRRHFHDLAQRELARAEREGLPSSLILFDIDGFKLVNDSFGHHVGDQVLRAVAAACKTSLRTCDVVARYGGDEFCVLLPHVGAPKAVEVAERLRGAVAGYRCRHERGEARVTVSVGVVGVEPLEGQPLSELMKAADEALYLAKREGGDCVVERSLPELLAARDDGWTELGDTRSAAGTAASA